MSCLGGEGRGGPLGRGSWGVGALGRVAGRCGGAGEVSGRMKRCGWDVRGSGGWRSLGSIGACSRSRSALCSLMAAGRV